MPNWSVLTNYTKHSKGRFLLKFRAAEYSNATAICRSC